VNELFGIIISVHVGLKSGMLHLYSVGEIHGKISLVQSNSTKNIGG
jgi:uncharacterized small protein (DUF1192 family)